MKNSNYIHKTVKDVQNLIDFFNDSIEIIAVTVDDWDHLLDLDSDDLNSFLSTVESYYEDISSLRDNYEELYNEIVN